VFCVQGCNEIRIRFRFELQVVSVDFNLLLRYIEDHRNFIVFFFDYLTSIAFIFAFDDSHHVARLKEFWNMFNIDLKWLCERGNTNCLECDCGVFNRDHSAFQTCQISLIYRDFIALSVDGGTTFLDGLTKFLFKCFVVWLICVVDWVCAVVNFLEILDFFVGRLNVCGSIDLLLWERFH